MLSIFTIISCIGAIWTLKHRPRHSNDEAGIAMAVVAYATLGIHLFASACTIHGVLEPLAYLKIIQKYPEATDCKTYECYTYSSPARAELEIETAKAGHYGLLVRWLEWEVLGKR